MTHKLDTAKLLALVSLYTIACRAPDEVIAEAGSSDEELCELIAKLSAATFPPCFFPSIPKTIATARALIEAASCVGSA